MRRSAALIVFMLTLLILLGTRPVHGADAVRLRVSPHMATAPSTLRIDMWITPTAADRTLEVWTDSGQFARSSAWTLDGADGPRAFTVEWPDLPAGHYDVYVRLTTAGGQQITAEDCAEIVGVGQ